MSRAEWLWGHVKAHLRVAGIATLYGLAAYIAILALHVLARLAGSTF